MVSGRVGLRLDGRETVAQLGQRLHVPAGMAHDWWNAGEDEAHIMVEITPAARFEEAISNTWGLALDGKTNARGMPNLLQLALLAREFEDVLYFTKPPRVLQKILFGILAPVARLLGYKGSYPEHLRRGPAERVEVDPWPAPSGSGPETEPKQGEKQRCHRRTGRARSGMRKRTRTGARGPQIFGSQIPRTGPSGGTTTRFRKTTPPS